MGVLSVFHWFAYMLAVSVLARWGVDYWCCNMFFSFSISLTGELDPRLILFVSDYWFSPSIANFEASSRGVYQMNGELNFS